MIRVSEGPSWTGGRASKPKEAGPESAPAWSRCAPLGLAFVTLWQTEGGSADASLLRVEALREENGSWRSFASHCRFEHASVSEGETLGKRIASDYGLHSGDVADAPPAASVLRDLRAFLQGAQVLTLRRDAFLDQWQSVAGAAPIRVLDLGEIAALCMPGRLSAKGEALATYLCDLPPEAGPRAIEPSFLRKALGILVARILSGPEPALAILAHTLAASAGALEREGSPRAADMELVLALLEHPTSWRDPARALEPETSELRDGRLGQALRTYPDIYSALDAAQPRWKQTKPHADTAPAPRLEEERTLSADDRRHIDEIFQEHLPRHFAARGKEGESYRIGQHGVASVIAEGFGRRELRLIHAPTGTGKTLAYLIPAALWAVRNDVRVGIATFTRVLQEQAMAQEAPLALQLLRAATGVDDVRIAVLKGRANYLCWRALCLQVRAGDDRADEILAWGALAIFATRDEHGDLDRFTLRAPLDELDPERHRRACERLLRTVRSETGCCSFAADRATCAAEAAWRTAERAHVVITNHALALARRDFFHHVVFDECEHLHDVALNAFSSSVGLRELENTLDRLHNGDSRRPLERVLTFAPAGSEASLHAAECVSAVSAATAALHDLGAQCGAFKAWRMQRERERMDSDRHALFREYALEHGTALLAAHGALTAAMEDLVQLLARLQESLESALPSRETARIRRALEVLRVALEEQRAGVVAWIPRAPNGRPAFGHESFHDLEVSLSGEDLLVTRVLLPHEHLGRHYYPMLAGAVLLSATTWLRGGFEAASAYLGLARAAEPTPDEEREPVAVHSFRAPEAFDYSRVLVAVPRDAPAVADKLAYLDYTTRFIAYLAERTRGRVLALFTNADDLASVGKRLEPFFEQRGIPFWWQRMRGTSKEELGSLFRARVDSVLLGLDAFWFGADFPGSTLEYLVLARLPYGVPDRYHHAQCAAIGGPEQRRTIYLPRAMAKFRQGFGRLMRKESDRGCVFVLDKRIVDPRHRAFMNELPVGVFRDATREASEEPDAERQARLVRADSERCLQEALAHMGMGAEVRRRGLDAGFEGWRLDTGE